MQNCKIEEIRKAASIVFSQKGYKETKIADIASRAGVSPGTIYKHFKNKKQIFTSINQPELEALRPHYEEKQKGILKAALNLFGDKGYSDTSMEDIASHCGISKAALYQYYKSKEDIFCETVQQGAVICGLDKLPAINLEDDMARVLGSIACNYLKEMSQPDRINLFRTLLSDSRRVTEPGELLYNNVIDSFYNALAGYFEEQKTMGKLRDINTKFAARAFMGTLMSFVFVDRLINPAKKEFEDSYIVDKAVDMFLNGIEQKQK